MSTKVDAYSFEGYKTHIIPQMQQFDTKTKKANEAYEEDVNFADDQVRYQQLDARLRTLEAQMKRLCRDADRAINNGMTDDNVYQVSNSSYQQAKINGIKQQFAHLSEYDN
jgi:hypothetical protein